MLRNTLHRLRHPKTTVRWRLTLLYGGLFLISGAALLAVTYTLVAHATVQPSRPRALLNITERGPPPWAVRAGKTQFVHPPKNRHVPHPSPGAVEQLRKNLLGSNAGRQVVVSVGSNQRISDLHQLIEESGIALAIMAIISALLGWLVAGRALRPLRTMTATTQQISEANLHERLSIQGPRDELRQLADTIDGLLERLEGAFDAQRRFVANASHELRTPLTAARAMLEMVLSDPHATVETFRATCKQVLEESEQQEQLIDALLSLAHSQRGIDQREPIDLVEVVEEELRAHELEAAAQGLRIETALHSAPISGDRRLVKRLVSNLTENAIRHNIADGHILIETTPEATLLIANDGPVVPPGEIERLTQPFQRMGQDRVSHREGLGLGLSIVAAIARAHDATLELRPRQPGGLDVEVRFPPSPSPSLVEPPMVAASGGL